MSILNQNYIVERYDGITSEYYGNIADMVEHYGEHFRLMVGTAFNMRKPSERLYRWDDNRDSAYLINVRRDSYSRAERSYLWVHDTEHYDRLVDCQYIIRNGFGRVVHPDVIYRAYLKEFGAKKTKFDHEHYRYTKLYFRGKRRSAYGTRHNKRCIYRALKQRVESDQMLDDQPAMRKNNAYYVLNDVLCWDEDRPRHNDKSWKTQSKAQKQWAKNLK